jgi:hypothetical protein
MTHRAARAIPCLAVVLAAGLAVGGCASATAGAASTGSASATARASASVYGPPGPDPACVAALKAEQTLQTRQVKDQKSESALDQDFTNFASALSAAAQQEKRPATARAMTALANDYTDLVESQSGAAQLPDMNTVQSDGAAFDKACSLFLTPFRICPVDHGELRRRVRTGDTGGTLADPARMVRSPPEAALAARSRRSRPQVSPAAASPGVRCGRTSRPPCRHASRAPREPGRRYDVDAAFMQLGLPGRGIHAITAAAPGPGIPGGV